MITQALVGGSLQSPIPSYKPNMKGDKLMTPEAPEELHVKNCISCSGEVPPLKGTDLDRLHIQIPKWSIEDEHHLSRKWSFKNFIEALDFVNQVAAIAEAEGHHPDISFSWGWVEIRIFTHKIDGLTESDFILAAKIQRVTEGDGECR